VYGTPEALPISEDSTPQPISVFGASKLGGEIYCRAYQRAHHLETVALRYLTVYGPRQNGIKDGAIVPTLVETLRSNRRPTIFGDGRAAHDFLYVDDAVAATLAAADAPEAAGQAINIGSGQLASVMEVLDILNRLLRTDLVPRLARARIGQVPPIRAEVRLAERLLGCAPRVSLVSGLARAVQFYAEQDEEAVLAEVGPSGAA
jgi:UDP-glucose 4-epimerase